jgi:glycosyltransferase involved in cell wall biosynthesis
MVHSLGGANRRGAQTPILWREAVKTINALRPDVVHAFWAYEPGVIAAWLAQRVPTIIHLAGGELIDLPDIAYGLRGKPHTRWLMRWALNRARIVTAGSRYLMEMAEKFTGGREIAFAPLGTPHPPAPLLPHPLSRSPEMEKHISGERELALLNVGSLEAVKDQTMLLRAFKRVSEAVPAARLIIAGQGRLESELRSLCQQLNLNERVTFAGEIAHEKLPELYRGAAVCVQSSRHEAQGMAVLEAAAHGVPLIGTAVGAIADLSPDAAVAVPVGDEASLAQAIISLWRDPARRAQLGRAAGDIVAREYTLTRTVDRAMMMYGMVTSDE